MPDHLLGPRQPFGATGLSTRPVGIGTAKLGAFWQGRQVPDGMRALQCALDAGVDLVDTADCYARGISERMVGRAVRGRDVTVMTKVGLLKTPVALAAAARVRGAGGLGQLRGLRPDGSAETCFEPGYVTWAAERCLRRQGVDQLDVLLLHEPDTATLEAAPFLPAMEALLARGAVRAWGVSVQDQQAAEAALALPGLTVLQAPVNLTDTSVVEALGTRAADRGVAFVAIAALGNGQVLQAAQQVRPGVPSAALVAELGAGVLRQPGVGAVVLGMSRVSHVREVLEALPTAGSDVALADDLERVRSW